MGILRMSKKIDILKKIGKVIAQTIAVIIGAITILSLFVGIYGSEAVFNSLESFFEGIFSSRLFLQINFFLTLVVVVVTSVLLNINIFKIRKKLHDDSNENGNKFQEMIKSLEHTKSENENQLQKILTLIEKEQTLGIISIYLRNGNGRYTHDTYKKIFKSTQSELIISGHSLNKTINNEKYYDLRNEFTNAIIRLIAKDCNVKILLLKPNNDELRAKREKFISFVKDTYEKLKSEKIANDIINRNFLIKETENLPYYIVKNEDILHIGHYTFGESQNNMYIFEATYNIGYGKYCYDDFLSFFNETDFISECQVILEGDK